MFLQKLNTTHFCVNLIDSLRCSWFRFMEVSSLVTIIFIILKNILLILSHIVLCIGNVTSKQWAEILLYFVANYNYFIKNMFITTTACFKK